MKSDIVAAMMQLGRFASEANADGLPKLAAETELIAKGLAPILARAELMEELWAAAKAWNAVSNGDFDIVAESLVATRLTEICHKVAKTETDKDGQ